MTVQIVVEGRNTPFMLNEQTWRWQSPTDQTEGNFPLIAFVDGKSSTRMKPSPRWRGERKGVISIISGLGALIAKER